MITTRLFGGLGNQMFQYAFAKNIALFHGTKLKVIDTKIAHQKYLKFTELFNVELEEFKVPLYKMIQIKLFNNQIAKKKIHKKTLSKFLNTVTEPYFHYWQDYKKISPNAYIHYGYWQSEKYFRDSVNEIRKIFTFKKKLTGENNELLKSIINTKSIAIHIRRGDYCNNQYVHHILDENYYCKAIKQFDSQSTFYIFTDSQSWVKNNWLNTLFDSFNCKIIECNKGMDSHFDMQLMAQCEHQIIANSTFSWWAAYLNKNRNKKVVAPKKWFNPQSRLNCKNLIPDSWIVL